MPAQARGHVGWFSHFPGAWQLGHESGELQMPQCSTRAAAFAIQGYAAGNYAIRFTLASPFIFVAG